MFVRLLIYALGGLAAGGVVAGIVSMVRRGRAGRAALRYGPFLLVGLAAGAVLGLVAPARSMGEEFGAIPAVTGKAELDRILAESDQPVLVDFYATWCGPCRTLAPRLGELAQEMSETARFVKVDVDDAAALAREYGVRGVPTVILFHNGRVAGRWVGARPKSEYREAIEAAALSGNET